VLGCRIAGAFSFFEPSKSALLRQDVRAAFWVVVALPRCVGAEPHVEERSGPGLREAEALAVLGELGGEAHSLVSATRSIFAAGNCSATSARASVSEALSSTSITSLWSCPSPGVLTFVDTYFGTLCLFF